MKPSAPETLRRLIENWIGTASQVVGLGLLIQQLASLISANRSDPSVVMAGAALVGVPEWIGKIIRASRSLERSAESEARERSALLRSSLRGEASSSEQSDSFHG